MLNSLYKYIVFCFALVMSASFCTDSIVYAQQHKHRHKHRHGRNESAMVSGQIVDSQTNEPIPGVNIQVVGSYLGSAASIEGEYRIKSLPLGTCTLRVSMMGYETVEKEVNIERSKPLVANFSMIPAVLEVNELVVTATGSPQLYKDAPVKTTVINRKLIKAQKASNLADVLDFQTGVRIEQNCQNCNFTQVRMQGMEGHHTQILIDSDPVVSSLAGVYGLEQFPDEMISRVEIVKGGGSALYGGSAVAGVVNLITNRPTHNDVSFDYRSGSIDGEMDHKAGLTLARVNSAGNSSGYLFASARKRAAWDANGDGFSEIGQLDNQAVGLNWYYKPGYNGELAVQLHTIHEDRRGGNKLDLEPHEADIAEAIETWRYGGSLKWTQKVTALFNYKAYISTGWTDRDTYYGAEQDPNAYGTSNNPLFVTGLQTNYRIDGHYVTAGVEYKNEQLEDKALAYDRVIDANYQNVGLVVQDSWKFAGENVELVYGSRLDKHSEIDNAILSPRAVMRWTMSPTWTFRGGVSTGFKAPQIFDEDLHITQVGGEGQVIRNSANLEEERAKSFYGGVEYTQIFGVSGLRASVNGFYTNFTNSFILDEQDDPATDEAEFYRINGDGSTIQGVEAEVGLRIMRGDITAGFTMQNSELDSPEPDFNSTHIFRTPDMYGAVRASYDFSNKLNALAMAKYTGPMYLPHYAGYIEDDVLEKSDSFITFDLILSYKIPFSGHSYGTFTVGAYNITDNFQDDFDKGVARDAGYVYGPLVPRRLLIGLSIGH